LVVAKAGTIYDFVGDSLVAAHAEFPTATGSINYHRIDGRVYAPRTDLLFYSDDKGVTRYRTGFPAAIEAVWSRPDADAKHVIEVFVHDKRVFSSVPVKPTLLPSEVVLHSIEMRPMLSFEGTAGSTIVIEASASSVGPWAEVSRMTATVAKQFWNDNRVPGQALFYRARSQ
jgi:hypothetical protein